MDLGFPELIMILVIVAVLFGPGRIANLGGELGKAIRAFREGMEGDSLRMKEPAAGSPKGDEG